MIFFYPAALDDALHGALHALVVKRPGGAPCGAEPTEAIGEDEHGITVNLPEAAKRVVSRLRQRHEPIAVTLGVTHVHA